METSACGQVTTGFQVINLGIAYTKGLTIDADGEAIVMPGFTYGKEFSRLGPVGSDSAIVHPRKSLEDSVQELSTPRASSVDGDKVNLSLNTELQRQTSHTQNGDAGGLSNEKHDAGVCTQDREDLSRLQGLVSLSYASQFTNSY